MAIEKKLREVLEIEESKHKNDSILQEFSKADKEFSELVKAGLAQKRGNHLLSPEDFHLKKYTINSK
ncbi:MAG: hypothetical protein R6U46_06035 [Marinilabilia sp.]